MTTCFPSRLITRLAILSFFGFCIAFWPLVGYAATFFVSEADSNVDSVNQPSVEFDLTASPTQVTAGQTITFSYHITNSFGQIISIAADDNLIGPTPLFGWMSLGLITTVHRTYVIPADTPPGPLVNTAVITATREDGEIATVTDTVTVLVTAPTALPEEEQPNQPRRSLFLPAIRP